MSWCPDDGVGRDSALGVPAKTSTSGQNTRLSGSNGKRTVSTDILDKKHSEQTAIYYVWHKM